MARLTQDAVVDSFLENPRLDIEGRDHGHRISVRAESLYAAGWLVAVSTPRGVVVNAGGGMPRSGWAFSPSSIRHRVISHERNSVQIPLDAFSMAMSESHKVLENVLRSGQLRKTWATDDRRWETCKVCGGVIEAGTYACAMHRDAERVYHHMATCSGWVLDPDSEDGSQPSQYIAAWDENENYHFFLAELPWDGVEWKDYDSAIAALKPDEVREFQANGVEVKRQGDVYAVATQMRFNEKKARLIRKHREVAEGVGWRRDEDAQHRVGETRHYATYLMDGPKGELYGYGQMWHISRNGGGGWSPVEGRHQRIVLDGPNWWRLVRNRAVKGWQMTGRVD